MKGLILGLCIFSTQFVMAQDQCQKELNKQKSSTVVFQNQARDCSAELQKLKSNQIPSRPTAPRCEPTPAPRCPPPVVIPAPRCDTRSLELDVSRLTRERDEARRERESLSYENSRLQRSIDALEREVRDLKDIISHRTPTYPTPRMVTSMAACFNIFTGKGNLSTMVKGFGYSTHEAESNALSNLKAKTQCENGSTIVETSQPGDISPRTCTAGCWNIFYGRFDNHTLLRVSGINSVDAKANAIHEVQNRFQCHLFAQAEKCE